MSSRFDRRSGSSSRSGKTGGRQGDSSASRGRRPLRNRFEGERGGSRSKREKESFNDSSRAQETPSYRSDRLGADPRSRREGADYDSRRFNENSSNSFRKAKQPLRRGSAHRERLPRRSDALTSSENFNKASPSSPEGESFTSTPPVDLVWGRHATKSALESGRPVHRIWCTSELRSAPRFLQLLREAKSSGVLVEEVTWARLGQITKGAVHQGIALQTAAAETLDLETLIDGCKELNESPLLIALDGLTDPQNLGAIVRSSEALGAHGLVLPQRRSAGLTGSVAKVAAGALEHLPVARVVNLNRSLSRLKESGYRVIGLAEEGDLTISEVDLEGPLVLLTGSEGKGISLVTRRHCDQLVRIPLRGSTPSLNASVATAIILYEVARLGWMKGIRGQAPSPKLVRPKCRTSPKSCQDIGLLDGMENNVELSKKSGMKDDFVSGQSESEMALKSRSSLDFKDDLLIDFDDDSLQLPFDQSIQL